MDKADKTDKADKADKAKRECFLCCNTKKPLCVLWYPLWLKNFNILNHKWQKGFTKDSQRLWAML